MIRRMLRDAHRNEGGLTLMELMVALSVSVIIVAAVAGFFVAAIRGGKAESTSDGNTRQSANVMNVVSQYIHAATMLPRANGISLNAIQTASPTDIAFYAYVNMTNGTISQPVQVEFVVDASGALVMKQWDGVPDASGYYTFPALTTTPNRTRKLGGPIASPTSEGTMLFSYLDANGNAIANASSSLSSIRAIRVNLELGSTRANAPGNTHIQNTLYLFNIGYAPTASPSS